MDITTLINGDPLKTEPYICQHVDNAEGRCDTLWVEFIDTDNELRALDLVKGAEVQAFHGALDTGIVYVSEIRYSGRKVALKALSTPPGLKRASSASWDNISFTELVQTVAAETGLTLKLLNAIDVRYETVTRFNMPPIQFLQSRLELESFCCKVRDNTLIAYDERIQERKDYVQQLHDTDFESDPEYSTSDAELAAACINAYQTPALDYIRTVVESGLDGQTISQNIAVYSIGESERYCKGFLRKANKYEYVATGDIKGGAYEAGQNVYLVDAPEGHAGLNYIYRVTSDFVNDIQTLEMRRPIKGDY